jgi:hypothetical protein
MISIYLISLSFSPGPWSFIDSPRYNVLRPFIKLSLDKHTSRFIVSVWASRPDLSIKMGMARWQSDLADESVSMKRMQNQPLPRR